MLCCEDISNLIVACYHFVVYQPKWESLSLGKQFLDIIKVYNDFVLVYLDTVTNVVYFYLWSLVRKALVFLSLKTFLNGWLNNSFMYCKTIVIVFFLSFSWEEFVFSCVFT